MENVGNVAVFMKSIVSRQNEYCVKIADIMAKLERENGTSVTGLKKPVQSVSV